MKIDIISISVKQKGEFSCLDIGLFLGNLKIIGKLEEFHLKHINLFFSDHQLDICFLEGSFSATFKLFGVGNKIYSIIKRTMFAY